MSKPIRVMIVDDQRVFAEALTLAMRHEPDIDVVSSPILSGEDAAEAAITYEPDVVLMDFRLPGIDGVQATREVKAARPEARVVILSADSGGAWLTAAAEAGASGFIAKSGSSVGEVADTVRRAAQGEILLSSFASLPDILSAVERPAEPAAERRRFEVSLTAREREVLSMLAAGMQNRDIARRLVVSPRTIDTHVHNLLTKLGVHSKLEAVVAGLRSGLVGLSDHP